MTRASILIVERRPEELATVEDVLAALPHFGLSSICNIVAAIKTAKALGLGAQEAVLTVATDGAAMYTSEKPKAVAKHFGGRFDAVEQG